MTPAATPTTPRGSGARSSPSLHRRSPSSFWGRAVPPSSRRRSPSTFWGLASDGGARPGRRPAERRRRDRQPPAGRAFVDLHCHTRGSFDSLSDPAAVMRAAHSRGLTHLAITDHDRIDVALRARDSAPAGLTIIVGSEVKTTRRRSHLPVPGTRDPAGPAGRRGRRGGPRAGRSGRHPAPVRSLPRARCSTIRGSRRSPASSTGSRAGTPGSSGGAATSTPRRSPSSTGCRRSPCPTPTPRSRSASRTRSWTVTRRRPTASWPRSRPPRSCPVGHPMSARVMTPLAKLVQRTRGNGRMRPGRPDGAGAGLDR